MKTLIKKFIPKFLLQSYHKFMAHAADFYYGHPSSKMIVIGVTGTKGKSSTCYLIAKILEENGAKVGMTSTAMFKIGEREWLNPYKMTMLGRFSLQQLLWQMVDAGCQYAIVETSSEGISQSRHIGIKYDVAVFTNLAPEHIEAHGSFEAYRAAKGKLFEALKFRGPSPQSSPQGGEGGVRGAKQKKVIVVNGDDDNAEYFLKFPADDYYQFKIQSASWRTKFNPPAGGQNSKLIEAEDVILTGDGTQFMINDSKLMIHLLGQFNLYNILAAITVAQSQGISLEVCKQALEKIKTIPGRMEFIDEGQSFKVIVDYAHNPSSFEALYETIKLILHNRIIHVFGATGGGRDKSKRAEMGRIAAEKADVVIVTTDDPYTEDPIQIAQQVQSGISNFHPPAGGPISNLFEIIDRKEAIKKAIELAQPDDIILITGKGCEQKMAIGGKMIPWDDKEIVREALKK